MKYGLSSSFLLLACLPGCGLISGSARRDPPQDPLATYEAFGRSLDPVSVDRRKEAAAEAKKAADDRAAKGLGRLDPVRYKAWLEEEKEALALALANSPADMIGTDRTSRLARGLALYKEHKLEGARETFLKLLKEEPAYYPARRSLGNVSFILEDWDAAREAYEIVLSQLGPGPRTDSNLGLVLLLRFPETKARARELLARHVEDEKFGMDNLINVVALDFAENRPEQAEALILKATPAHKSAKDARRLSLLLAESQYRQGRFSVAGPALMQLAKDPWRGQGEALALLFQVQRALGLFEDAKKTLDKIKETNQEAARRALGSNDPEMKSLTRLIEMEIKQGSRILLILMPEIIIDLIYERKPEARRAILTYISKLGWKAEKAARLYALSFDRDSDPGVRRLAYLLLARAQPENRDYLEKGIMDSDPSIRQVAVAKLAALPDKEAKESLFRALERENNPGLFRSLHAALCQCCDDAIMLDPGEDSSEAGREKRRLFWAKKLDILRSQCKEGAFVEQGKAQGKDQGKAPGKERGKE